MVFGFGLRSFGVDKECVPIMMEEGCLKKMETRVIPGQAVSYFLPVGNRLTHLNELVGSRVELEFSGIISCIYCGRETKKSFQQGYCFPCARRLARCDLCIVRPHTCRYDQGHCREPEWGERYCLDEHSVYLANSSGLKVGVTRFSNQMTRWIDQGAVEGLPLVRVATRKAAGIIEQHLTRFVSDKTNWRVMLSGKIPVVNLLDEKQRLLEEIPKNIQWEKVSCDTHRIVYPVSRYPDKIQVFNFDKGHQVEGVLIGIKGQYLLLDTGVINIRKFAGYRIRFRLERNATDLRHSFLDASPNEVPVSDF